MDNTFFEISDRRLPLQLLVDYAPIELTLYLKDVPSYKVILIYYLEQHIKDFNINLDLVKGYNNNQFTNIYEENKYFTKLLEDHYKDYNDISNLFHLDSPTDLNGYGNLCLREKYNLVSVLLLYAYLTNSINSNNITMISIVYFSPNNPNPKYNNIYNLCGGLNTLIKYNYINKDDSSKYIDYINSAIEDLSISNEIKDETKMIQEFDRIGGIDEEDYYMNLFNLQRVFSSDIFLDATRIIDFTQNYINISGRIITKLIIAKLEEIVKTM